MSMTSRHAGTNTAVAGIVDFIFGLVSDEDAAHMQSRLMDRNDEFGLDQIRKILLWITEEWGARPTQRSSGSSRSRKPAGQKSTRTTSASTS